MFEYTDVQLLCGAAKETLREHLSKEYRIYTDNESIIVESQGDGYKCSYEIHNEQIEKFLNVLGFELFYALGLFIKCEFTMIISENANLSVQLEMELDWLNIIIFDYLNNCKEQFHNSIIEDIQNFINVLNSDAYQYRYGSIINDLNREILFKYRSKYRLFASFLNPDIKWIPSA
ncbi:hypothetical protein C1H57_17385 [Clostridium sp. 2-1]|uniref:hypothetical protein n=1 Tax=Clostridium TaxID=1485 RepID=UPI000CDB7CB5|nr:MULTISPECIES: hypothetical protein [Clostridium]MBN7576234.1 hypothetical protein [Clostridium beijerinckii]MBN7581310.1 hypothetical protein [Clostridium beijerinckii]MBN7586003.1 hypothetical protein [Clostridium beijerinckii]MBO0521930.1 hypothetical protein [Clostridium beijerinckii]POO90033.1 hypothetical protein C1H57_17385 [Clostridium sp. 2-1]